MPEPPLFQTLEDFLQEMNCRSFGERVEVALNHATRGDLAHFNVHCSPQFGVYYGDYVEIGTDYDLDPLGYEMEITKELFVDKEEEPLEKFLVGRMRSLKELMGESVDEKELLDDLKELEESCGGKEEVGKLFDRKKILASEKWRNLDRDEILSLPISFHP